LTLVLLSCRCGTSGEGAFVGEKEQATAEGAETRQNIKMASTDAAERGGYIKMPGVEGERTGGPIKLPDIESASAGSAEAEQYIKMGSIEGERWKGGVGGDAATDVSERATWSSSNPERTGPVRLDPTPAQLEPGGEPATGKTMANDAWTGERKAGDSGGGGGGGEQAAGAPGSSNP
jgi:hypothetical protein